MSLQVWLPLNGNLQNKGLSDISVTNYGATIDNSGKIGKCYSFNGTNNYLKGSYTSSATISFTCWVYLSQSIGGKHVFDARTASGVGYQPIYLTNTSIQIGCSGSTYATFNYTWPIQTWFHISVVHTATAGKCYVNGNLIGTSTAAKGVDVGTCNFTIGSRCNQANYSNIKINDVRIYNHALSLKEVKEISKALVLHYPLNNKYIESTTNLITNEDCLSGTCYNGATNKYGYGANSDIYKEVTTFQGFKGTKVHMGTNGNNAYPYVYISNMFTSDGTNQPAYKTLSFDYYTNIGTSIRPYKLGSGNGTATYKIINSNGISTGTDTNAVTIPVVQNEWNHIEITFHGTTSANAEWGYIQNSPSHVSNTNNFWFFANMQLEAKDHATGYTRFGTTRNENIIYDTSGYQNNGIINNITCSSNTPRYQTSSQFTATNTSYIKVNQNNWMAQYTKQMTINLWAYSENWASQSKLFSCTETGGFNTQTGNSGYLRFPIHVCTNQAQTSYAYQYDSKEIKVSDLAAGWHMFTFIYNAEVGTKTYIDAQLHHTYNKVSYGIHFNTNARLFLGCEANTANPYTPYFTGKQSDFRIYYTCLSEEDILELYQNPALIDRKQNLYIRELVEI